MRFSKLVVALIFVIVTYGVRPSAQTAGSSAVASEILVKFRPGVSVAAQADTHRVAGGRVLDTVSGTGLQKVAVQAGDETGALARYRRNPNVLYAERNFIRRIPEGSARVAGNQLLPADHYFDQQWGLNNTGQEFYCIEYLPGQFLCFYIGTNDADIDAPEAWSISTGTPVRVAVVDTGVDYTHPDIAPNYVGGWDFANNDSDPFDDHGHGTHVSAIIAAAMDNPTGTPAAEEGVVGVAPKAQILAYKVCLADGTCDDFAIAKALDRAVIDGARVINMSLGGPDYSQAFYDSVQNAWNAGLVIVAAAGNNGTTDYVYPGAFPNVVSVGAFDEDDLRASFSTYGNWVDIAAPGNAILSAYPMNQCPSSNVPGDEGCYAWLSGTSMATPFTSGAAALVWSRSDVTSNSQVVDILLGSADGKGVSSQRLDSWTIHGGLNIANAMGYQSTNTAPIAKAGPDQTVNDADGNGWEPVTLDGSGSSDPDGSIVSYDWMEGGNKVGAGATTSLSLAVGTHTLTLQVTDNDGATAVDDVVVTVTPMTSSTSVHVGDLDGSSGGSKSTWSALVTATVHDANHHPVSGATVSGGWSGGGGGTTSCTTGGSGTCQMASGTLRKRDSSVTFSVTGISASGLTYAPADNHDPDGDSNGTVLSIAKP